MDKVAFLHQLESSAAKKDKILFAKTIYDLPADVIVGFTKEEFSRVIYTSHQFSSPKMDKLSNFLETKGLFFLKYALKGIDEFNNCLLSKFYYSLYVSLSENNKEKVKRVLLDSVVVCTRLAEMEVDSRENLETTIYLCEIAQEIFPKASIDYTFTLINEGNARSKLAEMGIDSRENLETAIVLYGNIKKIVFKTSEFYALALMNEGCARFGLAEIGIDNRENLENAIILYGDSRKIFSKTSVDYARALMNEGSARQILAEIGIDSRENLETAIILYGDSQKIFSKTSASYALALMNEANARRKLAEIGIDSRGNLENAVYLCSAAQKLFSKKSVDYACSLINEGSARQTLAEIGIDSKENLENAIILYGNSRKILSRTSASYALALMNEGSARQILAEIGIDSRENLEAAIILYGDAVKIFPKTSSDYAGALMNEGCARLKLAEMGIDSRENLEITVNRYGNSRELFSKTSVDYACALINEGNARQMLAEMGIASRENLETAISFYVSAGEIIPKKSVFYARALINEGGARKKLAKMDIENRENFEKSKKLYLESISILEELGDGWAYSVSLLNFNDLLKNNFYKTGERKYLEEWERNLGDIEEKIKNRDIRHKERLMARIHEIRANLLEFEGKSGINWASREYSKAFELSKDPFCKFMDEFCQARIDAISFCELVSNWKLEEKEGIFLDYYDYAVFECHLENALESTINEEDELKLAVEKLTEIRDRTQIKIIKDRVSAYIYLLQALIDCFNKDSYKEAAENVKEGCKIFREYEDKQGQQMCEIFHNAVMRKNPDAWQEIIRNRKFSSNFYSLLCEYSDRKRADIESHKLSQIYEVVNRTEEKVDQLQATLNQECAEIKDKIENGFDGTVSELREIKVKINSIQEDFEHLIQVSNKVSGNEGEFIREFVTQMLELMKNGDTETINHFLEEIVKNEASLEETLENSKIPEREKIEAKSKLADLKKIPGILKEKAKSFSVDVTKDVVVSLTSGEIIKLLTPVLSTAVFGVPIPSQVMGILLEAIRN